MGVFVIRGVYPEINVGPVAIQPRRIGEPATLLSAKHKKARPEMERARDGGRSKGLYEPFEHTPKDSPWKLSQSLTEVLAGAPKYGSVTRSCRL